jgi:hypothetical protein
MASIDRDKAVNLAQAEVSRLSASVGVPMELLIDQSIEVELGWIFFYQSSEYLATGDPSCQLAGNGPMFVSREGRVRCLPTHIPWQHSIEAD